MNFDLEKKYYVYVWYIKQTNEVFYVGKGTKYRYRSRKRGGKFEEIINKYDCESEIILDNLSEEEAFECEKAAISFYKGISDPLINVLEGGHMPPSHKGVIRSEETKLRLSNSLKNFNINHPEINAQKSLKMKEFFKTEEGKVFLEKSIEKRKTKEMRDKMSRISKVSHNTDEYKNKMSEITKKYYETHGEEVKLKGSLNPHAKKILQYDLQGNLIREYDTLTEAANDNNASVSKISAVARGVRKSTAGFVWKFKD